MRRKSQKLSGRAFIRYQRRLIGLTVAAAMMLPLTAGVVVMLMPPAQAVDNWDVEGANGVLHVRGALSESACSLEMATARQEVWLGELGSAGFQQPGDRGTPVAFQLRLKDCLRAPASNRDPWGGALAWSGSQPAVSVSFTAPADADAPSLIRVSGVSGLALRLADSAGEPVRLGARNAPRLLTPGQNTLTYTITPVRTPATLGVGAYRATIDFRLYYD
ncbi:fimbrial protein [Serratia rubidaea]|uniref:fimbrial protein n=1 Tax=Serratia rubidaea TaxID=61652 RepID=UPI0007730679|nr:fimbrial protein [Serratia rubidaea]AML56196.1 MrfE [Serratia rubidaea]WBF45384.1 type 1 fimbrial protein [Serratia rubidaea]